MDGLRYALQLIRETIRFMFVRVVGRLGESDRTAKVSLGSVEDYLSIKGQLIQEIPALSDDSDSDFDILF